MGTSTFAEATVMPEIALAKVPKEAPLDVLCTLACGATTGIGAALYIAKVEPGSTVAVFGAGLVGLGAVAGAKLAGAERIIIVDPSAERRAKAVELGATDELEGGDDVVEQILELTGGFGTGLHVRGDRPRRRHAPGRRGRAHGLGPVRHRRRRRARARRSTSSRAT